MPERAARHGEKITTNIARTVLWEVYPHRNSRVAVLLPVRLRLPSSSTATPYYFPNHYSNNPWTEIGGRSSRGHVQQRHPEKQSVGAVVGCHVAQIVYVNDICFSGRTITA